MGNFKEELGVSKTALTSQFCPAKGQVCHRDGHRGQGHGHGHSLEVAKNKKNIAQNVHNLHAHLSTVQLNWVKAWNAGFGCYRDQIRRNLQT